MIKSNTFVKKATNFILALTLVLSMTTLTPVKAFAAETPVFAATADDTAITYGTVVYSPISGSTSGYFSTQTCPNVATFNLPAKTVYVSYSFDSPVTGSIQITGQGRVYTKNLIPDGNAHTLSFDIASAGTYKVSLSTTMGSGGVNMYYAYNLYSNN